MKHANESQVYGRGAIIKKITNAVTGGTADKIKKRKRLNRNPQTKTLRG